MNIFFSPNQAILKRLWGHISKVRRIQLFGIISLIILSSFLELISLASITPFLNSIAIGENTTNALNTSKWLSIFHIDNQKDAVLFYSVMFGLAAIVAGLSKLITIWAITRFSFSLGSEFGVGIYDRSLNQPYLSHISRNSSEIIAGVQTKSANLVSAALLPILNLFSAIPMVVLILIFLVSSDPLFSIVLFLGIGLIYLCVIGITYDQLAQDSKKVGEESVNYIKTMQEGLSGIREIIISSAHTNYSKNFKKSFTSYQHALANIQIICNLPRYATEALAMMLIAVVIYWTFIFRGINDALIPTLGLFAYGAQKLLPLFQQIYSSIATINGAHVSIEDALVLLDLPSPNFESEINCDPIPFHSKICLEDVSFRFHNEGAWVLKNVNLTISKGERIGIIGKTGSGKSTLLDILMGLIQPVTGNLLVDGLKISGTNVRSWRSRIAQVPQDIFFTDGTIAENIAFGFNANEIDMERVIQAAEKAQISKTIDFLPDRYLTNIGERGIKFSGGQRQRLGIARALYKNADVIILDEATSALDSETEGFVMNSVDGLSKDLTIIVVAHRTSTLKNMDRVFEFSGSHVCGIVEKIKL